MMTDDIRILIADDHPIVRQGLRQVIERDPRLKIVAEAADGQEALDLIARLQPQVAVLDIDMPRLDGFSVAQALGAQHLAVAIVFLTVHREESFMQKAIDAGAQGFVLKDSAITDIVASIKAVAAGEHFISPAMSSYLVKRRRRAAPEPPAGLASLSPTERAILKLIAEYRTTKEIAEALHISPRTVETHRANICQKLELHGSHALMKLAVAHQAEL